MPFIVPINSSVFNTIEFVLVDLVIAAFVYVLTARLVGLHNCLQIKNDPRDVHLCDEIRMPLFDQGIVSTKREMFYIAVSIRMISWALILGASLLVKGISYPKVSEAPAVVRTLGSYSVFDDQSLRLQNKIRGLGCVQRLTDRIYFGEIRNDSCELSPELLSKPILEMGLTFKPTSVSTRGCITSTNTVMEYACNASSSDQHSQPNSLIYCTFNGTDILRDSRNNETCRIYATTPQIPCERRSERTADSVLFTCDAKGIEFTTRCKFNVGWPIPYGICNNAVVACLEPAEGLQCSGLISIDGTTHLCEEVEQYNMNNRNATCKWVKGGEWNLTDWIRFYGSDGVETVSNAYATAYASGLENRTVKVHVQGEFQQGTEVPLLWVVIMVVKVLIVIALFTACEVLRRKHGLLAVANDESGIYRLIRTTIRGMNRVNEGTQDRNERLRVELVNGDPRIFEENRS